MSANKTISKVDGSHTTSDLRRIIILGAGYGGLEAAKTLHKKLRKQNVDITLIDQNTYHTLLSELHEVAGNRVDSSSVQVSIEHVLEYTKVKFINDKIVKADLQNKKLYSEDKTYEFDYLITGVGSQPAFFGIPGIEENSFTLWSLDDAKKIYNHILDMFEKASKEVDPKVKSELLTFVVGGGGFTGVETIGELIQWTKSLCKQYNIPNNEVKLKLVEALPSILPILSDDLVKKSVKYLEKNGVQIYVDSPITEVAPDSLTINNSETIKTRTVIWTGGIKANDFTKELGVTLGKRGRIVVNEFLQTVEYPYVYAIGDNMEFKDDEDKVLPALVETAIQSGNCAAKNIAADIIGKEKKPLKVKLHGVMVSLGSKYAVSQLKGVPKFSGLLAMLIKHLVNLHYLFTIGGLELCWDYINHQFLHNNRKKGFLYESVISNVRERSFRFWLVPLRIWLGVLWLLSGLDKINNNWLVDQVIGFSDATTSATSSASLMSLVGDHTPAWYEWIAETIIYPNYMIFQYLIVITEVGLGLAFIFGAFTFIAGIASIFMNINFALSTGLPELGNMKGVPDLWFIAASFAMLAGAGRVLGVDHYLMPWLQNQLRHFQRNRTISLKKGWKW